MFLNRSWSHTTVDCKTVGFFLKISLFCSLTPQPHHLQPWWKRRAMRNHDGPGGGGTPIHYLYWYVPPNGVVIWSSWFRTGYPFQRRFLERGIKNCGSRLYLLLKIVADYEEAFIWCISRTNKEISFSKKGLFQFTNFLERSIKIGPFLERGISFRGNFFLEWGANLESWEALTHPKNTQVPPPTPRRDDGYLGQLVAGIHCIFEKAIRLPSSSDFLLIKTQKKKNASWQKNGWHLHSCPILRQFYAWLC